MNYGSKVVAPSLYRRLLREQCTALGFGIAEARRKYRPQVVARARVFASLRARGHSYPAIGRTAGYHHTTVLDLVRRLPALEQWAAAQAARDTRDMAGWRNPWLVA